MIVPENFTMTPAEISALHNAWCELLNLLSNPDALPPRVNQQAARALELLRAAGATRLIRASDAMLEKRIAMSHLWGTAEGMRSTWSMYEEVSSFSDIAQWPKARMMHYRNHWGPEPILVKITGTGPDGQNTWGDLWRAADEAIRQSGDSHHVFIEGFNRAGQVPDATADVIQLTTGS